MLIGWLDAHAGAIQSMATIVLVAVTVVYAWAAKRQADQARKQVDETQRLVDVAVKQVNETQRQTEQAIRQVDETQRQRFDQHRPVVHPVGSLLLTQNHQVDWGEISYDIQLQNVGTGVALIVDAVMFPPEPTSAEKANPRYSIWREPPLLPGQPARPVKLEVGRCIMQGDAKLDDHRLYAPRMPTPQEHMIRGQYRFIARLTLTYQDIFMRKHAAMFDYIDIYGWQCVALLPDVPRDLNDIEQEAQRRQYEAVKQARETSLANPNQIRLR